MFEKKKQRKSSGYYIYDVVIEFSKENLIVRLTSTVECIQLRFMFGKWGLEVKVKKQTNTKNFSIRMI